MPFTPFPFLGATVYPNEKALSEGLVSCLTEILFGSREVIELLSNIDLESNSALKLLLICFSFFNDFY